MLQDGYIAPMELRDVLDAIEDRISPEARQYIESFIEDEYIGNTNDQYYKEIFCELDELLMDMKSHLCSRCRKKKEVKSKLDVIEGIIAKEVRDHENWT